jgi:2-oxoglutarate dehydrogenase E2 component (dihydrolipoamide succinyltransferase)
VEIKSEGSGVITTIYAGEQQKIDVGANFIEYDLEGKSEGGDKKQEVKAPVQESKPAASQQTQAAPKTESQKVTPGSSETKTTQAQATTPSAKPTPSTPSTPVQNTTPTPHFTGSRNQRKEPMNRMRQRIAERLKGSQNTYATLTTFNECDMSEVTNIRNKFQEEFTKKYGVKLGFMSFFLRASAIALTEMPIVNSVIDGTDIIHRDYIDISVAVATPNGLMVPVLRNCESKSLADFELSLRDLSVAARENKIKIEDMVGGSFTVSNGGVYGSMLGTPIINPPQTAILGMHNIVNRAVVRGEEIVARPIM